MVNKRANQREEIYERLQSADEQITSSECNARFFTGQLFTFTFLLISVERKVLAVYLLYILRGE